jgi:hypothetical protein
MFEMFPVKRVKGGVDVCVHRDVPVKMSVFVCLCLHVCVFVRQVPMVGKGVVEALKASLAAVQGGGTPALPVQDAACKTLESLAYAASNRVRMRGWDRPGFEECAVRCRGCGHAEGFALTRLRGMCGDGLRVWTC